MRTQDRQLNSSESAASTSSVRGRHEKSRYEKIPKDMQEMKIRDSDQEGIIKDMEPAIVSGSGTETGKIIVTAIGGGNGKPKQTMSYMAERVVGAGSFGVVCQNLLESPHTHQLKLCDFGSAKMLVPGESNISHICSRYYRAPELIFGATEYTVAIDMWSVGCVMAELLLGQPLFPGESSVDQLVKIIKVLGTPTREELKCMNPNYSEYKLPQIKALSWHKTLQKQWISCQGCFNIRLHYVSQL